MKGKPLQMILHRYMHLYYEAWKQVSATTIQRTWNKLLDPVSFKEAIDTDLNLTSFEGFTNEDLNNCPHVVGCSDIMIGRNKEGTLMRLFYPCTAQNIMHLR
ncbi:unnamed protein product [Meganyctiphanes norvegica]|uniref:Uncharacterized protein n=1 Tax=Meganyctiphanes norvegica TaxID=48144 RepID=A0AAV2SIE4_MEGNR